MFGLLNKNKKEIKPTEKVESKKTVNSKKNIVQNKNKLKNNIVSNESKMESDKEIVINQSNNIPNYIALLSSKKGSFPLNEREKKDFAILLVDEEKNSTILLESIESRHGNKQHALILMDIRQKIRRSGHTVETILATRDIIRIINEASNNQSTDAEEEKRNGELQKDFDDLLEKAIQKNASDIHIEVRRSKAIIRFRLNGSLTQFKEIPVGYANEFAGVIYRVIAEEKDVTFKPSQPQDAVIDRQLANNVRMRVRLATMPAYPSGFDMVMRLLPIGVATSKKELDTLGYLKEQVHDIKLAISKPVGVTIISGTTGSGKSTTLVTILGKVIHDKKGTIKVITVEDPPEFELIGATQVPVVRSKAVQGRDTNPFAAAIRAAMRSDPDVLLIGETRDHDSCELLIHAVQSGHQVYTTLHAPSAIGIVSRLRSLGAPNDVLGSTDFISGLVYQTLVKTVCPHCHYDMNSFEEYIKNTGDSNDYKEFLSLKTRISYIDPDYQSKNIKFRNDKGCKHCLEGSNGRNVVAEVCVPDHQMISYFSQGKEMEAWHHWQDNGGSSALQTGIKKMLDGLCDPYDIEHKLGPLTSEIVMKDKVFDYTEERSLFGFTDDDKESDNIHLEENNEYDLKISSSDIEDNIVDNVIENDFILEKKEIKSLKLIKDDE